MANRIGKALGTQKNNKWLEGVVHKAALRKAMLAGESAFGLAVEYLGYDPRRSSAVYDAMERAVWEREESRGRNAEVAEQFVANLATSRVIRHRDGVVFLASVKKGQTVVDQDGAPLGVVTWAEEGVPTVSVALWKVGDYERLAGQPPWEVQYLSKDTAEARCILEAD